MVIDSITILFLALLSPSVFFCPSLEFLLNIHGQISERITYRGITLGFFWKLYKGGMSHISHMLGFRFRSIKEWQKFSFKGGLFYSGVIFLKTIIILVMGEPEEKQVKCFDAVRMLICKAFFYFLVSGTL